MIHCRFGFMNNNNNNNDQMNTGTERKQELRCSTESTCGVLVRSLNMNTIRKCSISLFFLVRHSLSVISNDIQELRQKSNKQTEKTAQSVSFQARKCAKKTEERKNGYCSSLFWIDAADKGSSSIEVISSL